MHDENTDNFVQKQQTTNIWALGAFPLNGSHNIKKCTKFILLKHNFSHYILSEYDLYYC